MAQENPDFFAESTLYTDKSLASLNWLTTYDSQFKILSPKLDYKDHLMGIFVYGFIAGAIWNLLAH